MKPRIILYNPRSSPSGKKILPMSILALGAVLEGRYEFSLVDGNQAQDPLCLLREKVREGSNLLAVTVMPGPQLSQAFPHCRTLKAEYPELIVVWGGYFPTLHATPCLRSPAADYVIRGHGELVFLEFLEHLERDADTRDLQGLAYRNGNGAVIENPMAPMPHPDQLPSFPYHRIDVAEYVRETFLGSRTLSHHSSYGCPFLCNFCAVVNLANGCWLAQSAERVARIAERYVARWQVNAIEFHDNNFFVQESRVEEIANRLAPLGLAWWGEARIDTLLKYSDKTWQAMKDSGLKAVFMGAESASPETLKIMKKGGTLTPEKTLEIARKTRQFGIVPEFSFIVGNPPDPIPDAEATMCLIRRIKKVNPASEIILYIYAPVPLRGQLYDAAVEQGFSFPDQLDEWIHPRWLKFVGRRQAGTPWVDEGLRRRIRDFERVLNACFPTTTDPRMKGPMGTVLRTAGAWRYHTRIYRYPLELRVLQKLFRYQRPETSGF